MRKLSKAAIALGTTAVVATTAGVAYAYWTAGGSGTGSSSTTTSTNNLLIANTAVSGLVPGDVKTLSATVQNPNSFSVNVNTVSAVVTASGSCDASWFHVAPQTPNARVAGLATLPVSTTITFDDTADNQDSCKNASLTLTWSSTSV